MLSERDVKDWLVIHLADMLDMNPAEIEPDEPLPNYGLDSVGAVSVAGALEEHFQVELEPVIFLRAQTVTAILTALKSRGLVQ